MSMMASEAASANAYELLIQGVVDYHLHARPDGTRGELEPRGGAKQRYTANEIIGSHFSRFITRRIAPTTFPRTRENSRRNRPVYRRGMAVAGSRFRRR